MLSLALLAGGLGLSSAGRGLPPLAASACPPAGVVYANDFEAGAGPEWSSPLTRTTPSGRRFLGEFGAAAVTLSLACLPAHTQIDVALDLLVIRSWDGNEATLPDHGGPIGPDVWRWAEAGGPAGRLTSFANWAGFHQSYPAAYPAGDYPARFGALEVNSLGYTYNGQPMDAVYHLRWAFPHTGPAVTIEFAGAGLQPLTDESWGLDNVAISVAPPFWSYLPLMVGGAPAATPTATVTASPTPPPTATPTATASATPTSAPSATHSATPTLTHTPSATPSASATRTPTPSATNSVTATPTRSATPTPTRSATPTGTASATPTRTPAPTATWTATLPPSPTASMSTTPSATRSVTTTATRTYTRTSTLTATATRTSTPTASATWSPTSAATPTNTATRTFTPVPTFTPCPAYEIDPIANQNCFATRVAQTRTADAPPSPSATVPTPTITRTRTPAPTPTNCTPYEIDPIANQNCLATRIVATQTAAAGP